jgi:hypothetical protein
VRATLVVYEALWQAERVQCIREWAVNTISSAAINAKIVISISWSSYLLPCKQSLLAVLPVVL